MKKTILYILVNFILFGTYSQNIENNREAIEKAQKELTQALEEFSTCIVENRVESCIEKLMSKATNEYQMYLIGGALYTIDPEKSFKFHEQAFLKNPNELNFILEYAIENHRKGEYEVAAKYYEVYKKEKNNDFRIDVWLSECYLNLGMYDKAIENWKLANHPSNHTGIDRAIYTIHGRADQIQKRTTFIEKIKNKDKKSAYDLIFLDLNWELDWWNTITQKYFIDNDLKIIERTFGTGSIEYNQLLAYKRIKELSHDYGKSDKIKMLLKESEMLVDGNKFPYGGKVSSDLLRIALINNIIDESEFFKSRGNELLKLADEYKDAELLNIYAYLEASVNGHVTEQTDKKGWNEYKDERFAISYFIGLADKNKYDNPELTRALVDFPGSSKIHWVKLNCAKIEGKDIKTDLIEVMKKEFKTLGSDPNKYSYALKKYFYFLENEK